MSDTVFTGGAAGAPGRIIIIPDEHILCDTPILVRPPAAVPQAILDSWLQHILDHIDDRFIPGWEAVLDTEDTFKTLLADPAVAGYADFLAPDRLTKRGLPTSVATHMHDRRLHAAYDKLVAAIDFLTGAGREAFEQRLTDSKDTYKKGEAVPLSVTGAYMTGILGAAVRQWFFINGTLTFDHFKWPIDWIEGSYPPDPPFLNDGPKWDMARAHNNLMIQGACLLIQGGSVADTEEKLGDWLDTNTQLFLAASPESFVKFGSVDGVWNIRTYLALA